MTNGTTISNAIHDERTNEHNTSNNKEIQTERNNEEDKEINTYIKKELTKDTTKLKKERAIYKINKARGK